MSCYINCCYVNTNLCHGQEATWRGQLSSSTTWTPFRFGDNGLWFTSLILVFEIGVSLQPLASLELQFCVAQTCFKFASVFLLGMGIWWGWLSLIFFTETRQTDKDKCIYLSVPNLQDIKYWPKMFLQRKITCLVHRVSSSLFLNVCCFHKDIDSTAPCGHPSTCLLELTGLYKHFLFYMMSMSAWRGQLHPSLPRGFKLQASLSLKT